MYKRQLQSTVNQVTQFQTDQANQLTSAADALRAIPAPEVQHAVQQLDQAAAAMRSQGLGPDSVQAGQIKQLSDGTSQLAYQLSDPNAPFRGGFNQLQSGTDQLPGKLGELQNGVSRLNDGAHELDTNMQTAVDGSGRLKDGAVQLDNGIGELHTAHGQLLDGAKQLHQGTGQAVDGTAKLDDGAQELHKKLDDGAKQVPHWTDSQRLKNADTIGGPVSLNSSNDSGTHTFGAGLAPFFFALALFIGGVITFVILRPLQKRAIASGLRGWRVALDGFMPAGLIAVLQAVVVVLVTVFAVGLHPANLWGLLGFGALVSVVWMLINQMCIATMGAGPGRVAALALLMLQMVASGGLYPVETQNKFLQFLHPFDPMTYAVNGFRQVVYGYYDHRLPVAIMALVGVGLVCFLITSLAARRQRLWTMETLHPPLPA